MALIMEGSEVQMQIGNAAPAVAEVSGTERLFSVGHSHHDSVCFLALLRAAGGTAVADVRSQPFSQRQPQFNRPELARLLEEAGIAYAFLGHLLGGRPQQPS